MLFFTTWLLAGAVPRTDDHRQEGASFVETARGRPKLSSLPVLRPHNPAAALRPVPSRPLPAHSSAFTPSLISRLRGGRASTDVEHVPPISRTRRLKILSPVSSQDPSVVLLSRADAEAMKLVDGDAVTLRGRKQRRTTAIVAIAKNLGMGDVQLSATSLHALRLAKGDDVIVAPEPDLPEADRVLLLPFKDDLDDFDGTEEDAFENALVPYLKDKNRPLTVGDVVETPIGDKRIRWKVMMLEPESVNPLEAPRGTVGPTTEIFTEGPPVDRDEDDRIGYSDIGGHEKLLETLKEFVDLPLRHPSVFDDVGVRPPKGVLLYGPPGSGKTMVAKAVETEAGVNFQTVNGPELMAKRSGDAEKELRKVFDNAAASAPSIIFIDEIDALAPKRDKTQGETEGRVVSQLLTLMDGIKPNSRVIVIGATNRPGALDTALRRFGRFDREIRLDIPNAEGRRSILGKKAKGLRLAPEVDLDQVAEDTHGCCGADLAQLLSEGAMAAVRDHSGEIDVDAEDVDPELLASIVIRPEHLKAAMEKMNPAALRDKAVEMPDTSWEDVGGLEEVKREMTETLTYPLKHAAKYEHYGLAPSKGMMLYGPPGTGKTLVAKAIANEVKSNFIAVKGPELLSMWFGESESNVRELFDKARSAAPCIIFFDEIDAIAKARGSGAGGGGESGDRIVNQILTEIDGVGSKKSVFVIAATNRPDIIDPALMRPGRIDQLVYLPLPDHTARVAVFKAATRKSPLAKDINLQDLADRTEGFSPADITEICQRACKLAIRQHIEETNAGMAEAKRCATITKSHFEEAFTHARKSVSAAQVKKYELFRESMKANSFVEVAGTSEATSFAELDNLPRMLAGRRPLSAPRSHLPESRALQRAPPPHLLRPLALRGGSLASRTKVDPDRVQRLDRKDVDLAIVGAKSRPYALRIDAGDADQEGSIALLHPKKMDELGLMDGDTIRLKGKRSHETLCTVQASEKVAKDGISLAAVTRANLHKALGEETKIYRLDNIRTADRILIAPFENATGGLELEDIHKKVLEPYFHGKRGKAPYRPVMEGDLIRVRMGTGMVECKVIATEPNSRCIVGPKTVIEPPDELLEREQHDNDIGYEDLGGVTMELAKVRELVELPMRHPRVYTSVGVRPPRGVLIHGPPGSGKTSIAKAVAAETGAYFFVVNGPEIKSGQPGESEANLRRAFEQCEKNSPAILFLDEIDAIAPRRDKARGEAEKRLVTQLISLLDGLPADSQVVVMAATNRLNTLEPTLRRFGRFDLEIGIPVPNTTGREDILRVKTRDMKLSPEIDLKALAQDTQGYCGADLAQLVFESAMTCVRNMLPQMDLELDAVPKLDLTVQPEHFTNALALTNPSTLRETAIEVPNVKWEDIGGLEEVKRDLKETVQYPVEHADKFEMFGMNPSKGVLFYGPPGCGKTLLAKAIANECNANFISVKGPELLTMWFGESEANVRDLFDKARQASPCVIFFDEMDSIAKGRGGGGGGGASEAGDRVINQILTEIDGVGDRKSVFVIGATNRPDILDSAIMRPGRLDQLIYIPLPDYDSRLSIFQANLRKSPVAEDVDLAALANLTEGFSGADITEVCQRACKFAIREDIAREEAGETVPKNQTDCEELPDSNPFGKLRKRHFDVAMATARKSVSKGELARYLQFKKDLSGGASMASAASAANAAADAATDR